MRASFGESLPRLEDKRFLTGRGCFLDDVQIARCCSGVFLRSPHAHADIKSIETDDACALPGVLAVITGADIEAAGLGKIQIVASLNNRDGSPQAQPGRPLLATGRVRFMGEAVALVVAETMAAARDAAEAVYVDYEPLHGCTSMADAVAKDAPQIWSEAAGNVCLDWEIGDEKGTATAFDNADHVVKLELANNRVTPTAMESRGCIGQFDRGHETYTLHVSSQGPHDLQQQMAREVLNVPADSLRVISPDVGGGFGGKVFLYPEYGAILWAAKVTGRPVKWVADRTESLLSDVHAREQSNHAALALDKDGNFLGLRVETDANMGAYASSYGSFTPTSGNAAITGLYRFPHVHCAVRCLFTNTVPLDAYRGAGKPEANFVAERLIDEAARQLGLPTEELRRRNLIAEDELPHTSALGYTLDSGRFEESLAVTVEAADLAGFPARRKKSFKAGKRRGYGVTGYFENTMGSLGELARVRLNSEGKFQVFVGTLSNGQGHETTFPQIVAARFGVSPEDVRVVQGDTQSVTRGHGTVGSRSLILGGAAASNAADKVLGKAKQIAGHLLEASSADLEIEDGRFTVRGTDLSITLAEVASAAHDPARLPEDMEVGLEEQGTAKPVPSSYPNGFHICEVEVDIETGKTEIVRYTTCNDVGNVINPAIVLGQIHGGTAQGLGQALLEECVYDDYGQLISGSFMDYAMPRAADIPEFDCHFNNVPCTTNPLGAKGAGEAGAVPAPAALINAIIDALWDDGVRDIRMPATPLRVWQAIQDAASEGDA